MKSLFLALIRLFPHLVHELHISSPCLLRTSSTVGDAAILSLADIAVLCAFSSSADLASKRDGDSWTDLWGDDNGSSFNIAQNIPPILMCFKIGIGDACYVTRSSKQTE